MVEKDKRSAVPDPRTKASRGHSSPWISNLRGGHAKPQIAEILRSLRSLRMTNAVVVLGGGRLDSPLSGGHPGHNVVSWALGRGRGRSLEVHCEQ
jgi:hypothetical protein